MDRVLLVTVLLAAVTLAGCQEAANDLVDDSPPAQVTNEEARAMLVGASASLPDRYGMKVTVTKGGAELMSLTGAFDNTTRESYFEMKADPAVFADSAGQGEEADLSAFADGISFFASDAGVVYLVNDTAFVFPAGEEGESSFVPDPEDSPFGQFLDPSEAFGQFDEGVTIHSVEPITHKGKAAYQIQATIVDEEEMATNATIVMYANPNRLARIEGDIPADGEDETFAGSRAVAEVLYDDEITITIPEKAQRAAGLQYTGGGFDFSGGEDTSKTWSFTQSRGLDLAQIEAQVKDVSQMGDESGRSLDAVSKAPTLWAMKLSDRTRTEGGVTLTFTDADGDGKVSAGDTLLIEGQDESGIPPQVVLYDTVTQTYVVPGFGLLALLAALGLVATLRRHG